MVGLVLWICYSTLSNTSVISWQCRFYEEKPEYPDNHSSSISHRKTSFVINVRVNVKLARDSGHRH